MRSLVLGHRGLVGSAIVRKLGDCVTLADRERIESTWLPIADHVYFAAAKAGGIGTNVDQCADMITSNLRVQLDVIESCRLSGAKLLFLGSSCIYPRMAPQPIPESALMSGPLEPTNSAYAMAKLAGIEMCRAYARQYGLKFVALMPCNLYGPGRPQDTHVIPMLMRRFHVAKIDNHKSVRVWGSGRPMREFMHVEDLAEAAVHFMNLPEANGRVINVGTGSEISIHGLATMIAEVVGYQGEIEFDHSKPDGVPRKVLDVSLAASMGWKAKIPLAYGLTGTYEWHLRNRSWS